MYNSCIYMSIEDKLKLSTSIALQKKTIVHLMFSGDCILKICEIVYNLLKGVLPLNSAQKRKLAPKKHILRRLVRPQSVQRRRALLVKQKGGFFPFLISIKSSVGTKTSFISSPIIEAKFNKAFLTVNSLPECVCIAYH